MRHKLVTSLSALALGWLVSSGLAGDSATPLVLGTVAPAPKPTGTEQYASPVLAPGDCGTADCSTGGHILGGAGLLLVKPHFANNIAYTTTRFSGHVIGEE